MIQGTRTRGLISNSPFHGSLGLGKILGEVGSTRPQTPSQHPPPAAMKHLLRTSPPPPPAKRRRGLVPILPAAVTKRRWRLVRLLSGKRRRVLFHFFPAKRRRGLGPHYAFKPRKFKQPILLLFETPSGFAIFTFSAVLLDAPDHIELIWAQFAGAWAATNIVWRNSFQTFEDKSDAINENTGVDERLVGMIMEWHHPGQIMAVGKTEYKKIIEERLHIPCLYGPIVMEIMWGIQNLMPSYVPEEKSLLTEEDCLPLSQELQKFLRRYDSDVKPEMVNDEIIKVAAFLYNECVSVEMRYSVDLREAGDRIKNLSDISCEDWSLLEIATAVKIICRPKADSSCDMIPSDVVSKLVKDAPLYEDVFYPVFYLGIYSHMVCVQKDKIEKEKLLKSLIGKAKEAYEAKQAGKPCGV